MSKRKQLQQQEYQRRLEDLNKNLPKKGDLITITTGSDRWSEPEPAIVWNESLNKTRGRKPDEDFLPTNSKLVILTSNLYKFRRPTLVDVDAPHTARCGRTESFSNDGGKCYVEVEEGEVLLPETNYYFDGWLVEENWKKVQGYSIQYITGKKPYDAGELYDIVRHKSMVQRLNELVQENYNNREN